MSPHTLLGPDLHPLPGAAGRAHFDDAWGADHGGTLPLLLRRRASGGLPRGGGGARGARAAASFQDPGHSAKVAEYDAKKADLEARVEEQQQQYLQAKEQENAEVENERQLGAELQGRVVLNEKGEEQLQRVNMAQEMQQNYADAEKDALDEKVRLLRELEALQAPVEKTARIRPPMVSAEEDPQTQPVTGLTIQLTPGSQPLVLPGTVKVDPSLMPALPAGGEQPPEEIPVPEGPLIEVGPHGGMQSELPRWDGDQDDAEAADPDDGDARDLDAQSGDAYQQSARRDDAAPQEQRMPLLLVPPPALLARCQPVACGRSFLWRRRLQSCSSLGAAFL